MIAIPAVDLREGSCVQLVGGRYDAERIRLPDAAAVALRWSAMGFRRLHVVDLDAATGRGGNGPVVEAIRRTTEARLQVGGGIRDADAVARHLHGGIEAVVLGTRALEHPAWLSKLTARWPGRIIVAADVRGRSLVVRGWTALHTASLEEVIDLVNALPVSGVLITAVHAEGLMAGPDLALMRGLAARCRAPLIASGGITTREDLLALADAGVARAVIGMALYTGALDARATAEEFGA
jgi:phosphoribosylformimino-5-aminoimidazole carboxamide ribotide isomerase